MVFSVSCQKVFKIFFVSRLMLTGRFLNASQKCNNNISEGKLCSPNLEIVCDFKFYKFINILAKFGRSSPGQFGARTFLSKNFSKFFVLWSLKVFLFFHCLYLGLYYLKVVCTQFFCYLFQDWLFHLEIYLYFNDFWPAKQSNLIYRSDNIFVKVSTEIF